VHVASGQINDKFVRVRKFRSEVYQLITLLTIFTFQTGCSRVTEETPKSAQEYNQEIQVTLTLADARELYTVGEIIALGLHINNDSDVPFVINNFDFQRLVFAPPNAFHLLGPDGKDLLLPYSQTDGASNAISSTQVEAKGELWDYLPLSNYLHLRQTGNYTYWIELVDDEGKKYISNKINFSLMNPGASVPTTLVDLLLRPEELKFSDLAPDQVYLDAVLKNNSNVPLTFLKPQDGSLFNWIIPVYRFTLLDEIGRSLPLPPRSGTLPIPTYNEATMFTLQPGASFQQRLSPPFFVQKPGEYKLDLTYIVYENHFRMGTLSNESENWEEGVFIGMVKSNEITIIIEE
jgi:hypothetical protein